MTTTATVNSSPITATVANGAVSVTVTSSSVSASAAGGVGPQGPAGSATATTDASLLVSGTLAESRLPASVVLTTDGRLSDARTPTAHSHAVADVTGLQTALDAKQPAGSYAAASHTHTAGQVSGLAAVATSGSYTDLTNKPTIPDAVTSLPASSITGLAAVATSGAYADLSGKPSLFSGSYADLTNTPASFAPSAHNQAWSTITSTPTTLSGYGITDAVGSSDSRLSDARTPTSHTHPLSSLEQSGATTGQVAAWNGSAWAPATATGSSPSIAVYASVGNFPATGSETTLYLDESSSRLFQWESPVYVEIGASGGGAPTTSASDLTSGTLADARLSANVVLTGDSRLSDARTPTSHVHGNLTNAGAIGSSSGQVVVTTTSGVLTTAATISAASQVSGLAAVATSGSASDIGAGTLPFARLPVGTTSTTVAAGNDSRLSDTRTPTDGSVTDAKITSSGLSTSVLNWAAIAPWAANTSYAKGDLVSNNGIAYRRSAAGTSGATFNAANWQQITPSEFLASQITGGTLPDARLSTNVPLLPGMMLRWSESSASHIDVVPRLGLTATNVTVTSGQVLIVFFTPLVNLTVSQITMGTFGTAASGLTLARMGIYTYDESTATLVARTASDTSLFNSTRTLFTRSLDTTGGFPATYTLNAGTRYGVGVICTGTTMPTLSGVGGLAEIAALSPRLASARTGQTDLGNLSSLTAGTSQYPWARLS